MKYIKMYALSLCCLLGGAMMGCSDDDNDIKSSLTEPVVGQSGQSVSSLSFSWDRVEHATQYGYELADPQGVVVAADVTTVPAVTFTGLKPSTTYTLSVWAYSKVYGDVGNSKIAALTATTAATEQLAKPVLEVNVANGVAEVSWAEVPNATSYTYSYELDGEEVSGTTSSTRVDIEGLQLAEYTVSVYASSSDEVYTASEVATITFSMTHTESWTVTGVYTSSHLGETFNPQLVAYDDNTYALKSWYGVEGYDFDFRVDNGVVVPYGEYGMNDHGEYIIPTGRTDISEIYIASTGNNVSTFTGNAESGEIKIVTCNYSNSADTYVWVPARKEIWTADGKYFSHETNETYDATIVAYDDNSYTILGWYGVEGYDLRFKTGADGLEILEYYGQYDNGLWVNTGQDEIYGIYVWPWDNYSYMEGNRMGGTLYLYTMWTDWGYDTFTWGDTGSELTIDDLVGTYSVKTTGMEMVTDFVDWYDFDWTGDYEITKVGDDSLSFDGFYWSETPVVGKVDIAARTVTFESQEWGYYTFAGSVSETEAVVGTIEDDLSIKVEGWNAWYYGSFYFYNTSTVFTKK